MSDLREALEAGFDKLETTPEVVQPSAPAVEPTVSEPAVAESKPRDDVGRFAAKSEPIAPVEPVAPTEPAPVRKAPSSWKPAAQEAFLKADRGEPLTNEEIKLLTTESERREADFHKGVAEFKTHSERARAYDTVIAPYQGHLDKLGVDAPTAINALMRADVILRTSDPATKANYFQQLAREYGIDLGQAQNPAPVDPQMQFYMQQINELRQNQQMWQNQQQQQEQAQAQQEVGKFATADKTHFDAVRNDMADLLQAGKAQSLEEAYEMAVWMRPDIRSTLIEKQRAEAQKTATDLAQAQRAKTAAISVKGSSPSAGGVQPVKGSLREILEANFAD